MKSSLLVVSVFSPTLNFANMVKNGTGVYNARASSLRLAKKTKQNKTNKQTNNTKKRNQTKTLKTLGPISSQLNVDWLT